MAATLPLFPISLLTAHPLGLVMKLEKGTSWHPLAAHPTTNTRARASMAEVMNLFNSSRVGTENAKGRMVRLYTGSMLRVGRDLQQRIFKYRKKTLLYTTIKTLCWVRL